MTPLQTLREGPARPPPTAGGVPRKFCAEKSIPKFSRDPPRGSQRQDNALKQDARKAGLPPAPARNVAQPRPPREYTPPPQLRNPPAPQEPSPHKQRRQRSERRPPAHDQQSRTKTQPRPTTADPAPATTSPAQTPPGALPHDHDHAHAPARPCRDPVTSSVFKKEDLADLGDSGDLADFDFHKTGFMQRQAEFDNA